MYVVSAPSRSSRAGHLPLERAAGLPTFSAFFVFLFSVRSIISICFFIHCPPCCCPAALLLAPLPLLSAALVVVEADRALRCRHAGRAATRARAAMGPESVILDVLATAIVVYVCMMRMARSRAEERKPKRRSRARGRGPSLRRLASSDANSTRETAPNRMRDATPSTMAMQHYIVVLCAAPADSCAHWLLEFELGQGLLEAQAEARTDHADWRALAGPDTSGYRRLPMHRVPRYSGSALRFISRMHWVLQPASLVGCACTFEWETTGP